MIFFVVSQRYARTHHLLVGAQSDIHVELLQYGKIPNLLTLPRATYVFTDLDRLTTEMLRIAARFYRSLQEQGCRVLNDPARVLSRWGLLRALFREGVNQFNAYRAEDVTKPDNWPVFIRTEGDHMGPMPQLFATAEELERGLEQAIAVGMPLSRLLIVEYAAQPARPGLYRKFSSFRVGDSYFAHTCVHDTKWVVKNGQKGIAPPEFYQEELEIVRNNPHGPAIAKAFDLAGLEYGRADFGLVDGKVQVYEINSNPTIRFEKIHPSPVRLQSDVLFEKNYFAALRAIDTVEA